MWHKKEVLLKAPLSLFFFGTVFFIVFFCSATANGINKQLAELRKFLTALLSYNGKDLVHRLYEDTRIEANETEMTNFYNKYIRSITFKADNDGKFEFKFESMTFTSYRFCATYGTINTVLYVSAALGAAMDLSVGEDGVLDFTALMANVEAVLTSPETVWAHFADFSGYSAKITLLVAFALGIYALLKATSKKHLHRKGVEHGSARWATAKEEQFLRDNADKKKHKHDWIGKLPKFIQPIVRKILKVPPPKEIPFQTDNNILLTQEVRMSLNTRQHRENLNVLVIGGSGAGKSRFYVKPNLMQLNTSYVITDTKGELLRSCGKLLKKAGYEIRVFNLTVKQKSNSRNTKFIRCCMCYN